MQHTLLAHCLAITAATALLKTTMPLINHTMTAGGAAAPSSHAVDIITVCSLLQTDRSVAVRYNCAAWCMQPFQQQTVQLLYMLASAFPLQARLQQSQVQNQHCHLSQHSRRVAAWELVNYVPGTQALIRHIHRKAW
jgi:hypothetical protein